MRSKFLFILLLPVIMGCKTLGIVQTSETIAPGTALLIVTKLEKVHKFNDLSRIFYEPGGSLLIVECDGKKTRSRKLTVSPGLRQIKVKYQRSGWEGEESLSFYAESGIKYDLFAAETSSMLVLFWIEDSATRKVVAGQRPAMFNPQ